MPAVAREPRDISLNPIRCTDAELIQHLAAILDGADTPPLHCTDPIYLGWRRRGRLLHGEWYCGGDLAAQIRATRSVVTQSGQPGDTLEICLSHDYQPVRDLKDRRLSNNQRGRRGLLIGLGQRMEHHAPSHMIASNRGFPRTVTRFLERRELDLETFFARGGRLESFQARQLLVRWRPEREILPLHRGNRVVPLEAVNAGMVSEMIASMGGWLHGQVADSGALPYKYWPSRGEYSGADNPIRQFMATVALIRHARHSESPAAMARSRRNLDHNLARFFRVHRGLGVIHHDGAAKLGAAALAALAILELPDNDAYQPVYTLLCRGIEALWQADGAFETFHYPTSRKHDNRNFYPGEALLFLVHRYIREQDPDLFAKILLSFGHYRQWHRANRNPAFIPWHTRAYGLLFQHSHYQPLRDFVFEMNDWLLALQQRDGAPSADLRGRFYDPAHPEYGPPHASATGVYLEGLAMAYRLALEADDDARAGRYRQALREGIRNLRQLQFLDEVDGFYLQQPEAVRGAVRTEVYDNTVRIDNVQHGLMALLDLVDLPGFEADPTSPAEPGKLRHFRHLRSLDIAPLLAEVEANAECWSYNTRRQKRIRVQRETNTIALRGPARPIPEGIHNNDHHPSEATPLAPRFPTVMGFVEDFARQLGGELGRVNVVRLQPRGQVYRHIDHGKYYRIRDRYHLVLQSPGGSLMEAGSETVRMGAGELWWFDNKQPHEAFNESGDWRVHVIFDVLPPQA